MINSAVYLDDARWRISIFILEQCGEGRELAETLSDSGCIGSDLTDALNVIDGCSLNVGLTFSNPSMRNSIVMVGLQEDRNEFVNTLFHELHHVVCHICKRDDIDIQSERAAYMAGDVGEALYITLKKHGL